MNKSINALKLYVNNMIIILRYYSRAYSNAMIHPPETDPPPRAPKVPVSSGIGYDIRF